MEVSLTVYGVVVIPLVVGIAFFKRHWLLPALMIASTLQAQSILSLDFGNGHLRRNVSAFSLITIFIAILLSGNLKRLYVQREWLRGSAGLNMKLWLGYAAIAIVSAAFLPFVFDNLSVYLLVGRGSFEVGPMPLRWSISNIVQAVNLILLIGVFLYIRLNRDDRLQVKRMIAGLIAALLLSVLLGLQQRLAWHQNMPLTGESFAFSPGNSPNLISYAGQIARVNWPFADATYGSAWYAAMFGGCLVVFFVGKRRQWALLCMVVSTFALLNCLGVTGVAAIGLFCMLGAIVWVIAFIKRPHLRWALGYQFAIASLVVVCCSLAVYIVLRHNGVLPSAHAAVLNLLAGKNTTLWGDIQPQTNLHGLKLLRDTFGLGVGLGSNRASSYFVSLFSNTGILGGVVFLMALTHLMYALARNQTFSKRNDTALFLFGSLCTATIAVALAVPDPNWPSYWAFILVCYAWISQKQTNFSPSDLCGPSNEESEISRSPDKATNTPR